MNHKTQAPAVSMTPAPQTEYRRLMTQAYYAVAGSDPDNPSHVHEAIDNLIYASEHIRACQLLALDPDHHEWESDFEMIRDLQAIGITEAQFQADVKLAYHQFLDTPTPDPAVQYIQSWYQVVMS